MGTSTPTINERLDTLAEQMEEAIQLVADLKRRTDAQATAWTALSGLAKSADPDRP